MGDGNQIDIRLRVRHWLPIITFCPVNKLPDVIYVTMEFDNFVELYQVRRQVRKLLKWETIFMEEAAGRMLDAFPNAVSVTVALAFNRHVVTVNRG